MYPWCPWCPNSKAFCTIPMTPRPKTGFFMYSSREGNQDVDLIKEAFSGNEFKLDDAMVRLSSKDIYCKICQKILVSAFGVALLTSKTPKESAMNIYLEIGLMKAFGKEVIILTDDKDTIASDLKGKGVFQYKDKHSLEKAIRDWVEEVSTDIDTWKQFGEISFAVNQDYEMGFALYQKAIMLGDFDGPLKSLNEIFNSEDRKKLPISRRFCNQVQTFLRSLNIPVQNK